MDNLALLAPTMIPVPAAKKALRGDLYLPAQKLQREARAGSRGTKPLALRPRRGPGPPPVRGMCQFRLQTRVRLGERSCDRPRGLSRQGVNEKRARSRRARADFRFAVRAHMGPDSHPSKPRFRRDLMRRISLRGDGEALSRFALMGGTRASVSWKINGRRSRRSCRRATASPVFVLYQPSRGGHGSRNVEPQPRPYWTVGYPGRGRM